MLFMTSWKPLLFVCVNEISFVSSFCVQGMYEDSIRYYVRALAMNPKADNAWQYLRISLRYVHEKKLVLGLFWSSSLNFNRNLIMLFSFVAAVLQEMTCWKLVILGTLMFSKKSSHYNIIWACWHETDGNVRLFWLYWWDY